MAMDRVTTEPLFVPADHDYHTMFTPYLFDPLYATRAEFLRSCGFTEGVPGPAQQIIAARFQLLGKGPGWLPPLENDLNNNPPNILASVG